MTTDFDGSQGKTAGDLTREALWYSIHTILAILVLARIPTITTLAAARAAAEGMAALQQGTLSVIALQTLHAAREKVEAYRTRLNADLHRFERRS